MEPVKGGNLVNLPEDAKAVLEDLHGGSPVSYAIRFVAGFPGMMMVLSGMSSMEQMRDNLSFMADFRPLNDTELAAIVRVQAIFRGKHLIPCTSCRYCTDGCPKHIAIPDLFATMNTRQLYHDWNAGYYYDIHTMDGRKASDCVKCGKCEHVCPQHLPIRKLLEDVAKEYILLNDLYQHQQALPGIFFYKMQSHILKYVQRLHREVLLRTAADLSAVTLLGRIHPVFHLPHISVPE